MFKQYIVKKYDELISSNFYYKNHRSYMQAIVYDFLMLV